MRGSISLYQGCKGKIRSVEELDALERTNDWWAEPKYDGIWICTSSMGPGTEFISRTGQRKALCLPPLPSGTVLVGEAAYGSQTGVQRRASVGHDLIDVFDVLQIGTDYLKDAPGWARRRALERFLADHKELQDHYLLAPRWDRSFVDKYMEQVEGLILKPKDDGPYVGGKVDAWLKAKKHPTNDYVILGSTTSDAETKAGMCRNIICGGWVPSHALEDRDDIHEQRDGWFLVELVRVGSMTFDLATRFEQNIDSFVGKVVEVAHYGLFESGACRHPSLVRIRDDKPSWECRYR